MFDLVLRNGTVIDGTNGPRRLSDVAVQGGRLIEVGVYVGRGREEIDARGKIVAPGFIDAHTHDDLALLVTPDMKPKVSRGVTTGICGNCGVSLDPLTMDERITLPEPLNMLVNAHGSRYRTARDYLQALRDTPAAVNCSLCWGFRRYELP